MNSSKRSAINLSTAAKFVSEIDNLEKFQVLIYSTRTIKNSAGVETLNNKLINIYHCVFLLQNVLRASRFVPSWRKEFHHQSVRDPVVVELPRVSEDFFSKLHKFVELKKL